MNFCGENEYMLTRDNLPHSECDILVTFTGNCKNAEKCRKVSFSRKLLRFRP